MKAFPILAAGLAVIAAIPANAASFITTGQPMMRASNGFGYSALLTIGDTLPNSYRPEGLLDGIGAFRLNANTVRLLVNHEIGASGGSSYNVVNGLGGSVALTGARVSFFDIDRSTKMIVNGGLAYDRIYDRVGNVVTNPAQIGGGLNRLCSSAAFEANSYGPGRGLADRAYFTGEETGNGTMFVLDTASNQLHAAPAMGRGAWENATQLDTGTTNRVAFVMSDDSSGSSRDPGTPLYMYVGEKNAVGEGGFLDRNGLARGDIYVWAANDGKTNPTNFNGNGATADGRWVKLAGFDATKAGQPGYDAQGYADQATLKAQATAVGAFRFSRPEDVATQPGDATTFALASTGSGRFGTADQWGMVYTVKTSFAADGTPTTGSARIVYDGNADSSRALRSPDNLDWSGNGALLVQEDQATDWAGAGSRTEAQIVRLDLSGKVTQVAVMDRTATSGYVDTAANDLGAWESSGILDVSALFGEKAGTLFVGDVQAHGLKVPGLVEGGQLFLLKAGAVPEPATWSLLIGGFGLVGLGMRRRTAAAIA